jgi:SAM-dependent methyltransferase
MKFFFKERVKDLVYYLFNTGILPRSIIPFKMRRRLIAGNIFRGLTIVKDKKGFYCLNPMPTTSDLDIYYKNMYWQTRGKDEGVIQRDLEHWMQMQSLAPDFFKKKITFMNFGAGHGGISHLFYHFGHKVINIEPSGLLLDYADENWQTFESIDGVNSTVDLVYGSHSLEHVQNIDEFWTKVKKIIAPDGLVFMEVPNGEVETNGGQKMQPPHTYYFMKNYFNLLSDDWHVNETFSEGRFPNIVENNGSVIRFFGKYNKK